MKGHKAMYITFAGDLALARYFEGADVTAIVSEDIVSFIHGSTHVVVNLEAPCTSSVQKKNGLRQEDSEAVFQLLSKLDVDVCSLANNHMSDSGKLGIVDTLQFCEERGFQRVGAGETYLEATRPILFDDGDIRVGLLSVNHNDGIPAMPGRSGACVFCDVGGKELLERVQEARELVDHLIVVYHGGTEFVHLPDPRIRKRYLQILGSGADTIIAHHPHVIQGYEEIDGKHIFYSLGNFVFDTPYQRRHADTDEGMLLRCNIKKEEIEFEPCFTKLDRHLQKVSRIERNESFKQVDPLSLAYEYDRSIYDSVVASLRTCSVLRIIARFVLRPNAREKYITALSFVLHRKNT